MADEIKVGIIGAGRMGITHHSIINAHPKVRVTAVADPSSLMTTLLSKYVGVHTHKDAASLLAKETVDAILLCTPPALNYDILKLAHAKGVHAFVEKPFLLSAAQADEIARLFDEKGLVNQVGYVNRFNSIFVRMKQFVEQGVVGTPLRFRSEMYSNTITREQEESGWRAKATAGGGVVYEMASHAIDLINYLFGRPDSISGSALTKVFSQSVEDIVSSNFFYRSGLNGSLHVNWSDESYRKPTNRLEVFGKGGKIAADQYGIKTYLMADNAALGLKKGWNDLYITDVFENVDFYVRGLEFSAQLEHFVTKVTATSDRRTRCSFSDGATTLALIEDLFRDAAAIEKGVQ